MNENKKPEPSWKVGKLLNPLPSDREFVDWDKACDFASDEALRTEVPFGVWLFPDGALDAIAYNGQLFRE